MEFKFGFQPSTGIESPWFSVHTFSHGHCPTQLIEGSHRLVLVIYLNNSFYHKNEIWLKRNVYRTNDELNTGY